jgi:tRNA pseudouridine38-40 synthase
VGAVSDAVTVLTVAYDGAAFHGFARQEAVLTVQGRLEEALGTVLRREVEIECAGRTDTGVHALGQVVSFAAREGDPDAQTLLRAVGALAGPEIVVTGVRDAAPGFSARHTALAREYRYRVVPGPVAPLFLRHVAWWAKGTLELSAMREGASHLLGEHDFRSFCVADSADGKRMVRDIEVLEIEPACELGEHCIVVRVVGRSFLHSMVRIVVGTLVEVGKGRRDPAWIGEALSACDRAAAGPTAPPHGLTLWHVTYPDDVRL